MEKNKSHPSYANLYIGRSQYSARQSLFGSSIQHDGVITLKISPASVSRSLNKDWYYAEPNPYIEVIMSQSQFAQAITSLNMGDGTPVTLTYLNGQRIEQCPYEDKRKVFDNELSTSMQKLAKDFKEIEKDAVDILENKRTLSKSDREIILKAFSKVYRKLTDEMPFIYSQFNEQMDKTVTEAKAEIECHIQARKDDLAALAMKNIAVGVEPTDELPESEEAEDSNLYEEYENEEENDSFDEEEESEGMTFGEM